MAGRDQGGGTPPKPGLRKRFRYRFDNLLARGTTATLLWLGVVTVGAVLLSSLLLRLFGVDLSGSEDNSWIEDVWQSLLRTLDSGTMANDTGWGRRVLALLVTVFGLLVAGTLIGLIANGVEDRTDRMRRGRSVVIESDHFVVLGNSDRLPMVVEQLALAGAGDSRTIVILADRDPSDIRNDVYGQLAGRTGARIVFRSGNPALPSDLTLVQLPAARSIIVLADEGGDTQTIKTVLGVRALLGSSDVPVVVEVDHQSTGARLTRSLGSGVHPLATSLAVGRLAAFALRQTGLGEVVESLTDFRGADIDVIDVGGIVGQTFGDVVTAWANARPIGVLRADGSVDLLPPMQVRLEPGDQLVLIADDASQLEPVGPAWASRLRDALETFGEPTMSIDVRAEPSPEHIVVLGWSPLGAQLINEWVEFASPSSTVEVVVRDDEWDPAAVTIDRLDPARLTVTVVPASSGLDSMSPLPDRFTIVLVLAHPGAPSADDSDIRTLLDLLQLRRDVEDRPHPPRILAELIDIDNAQLVARLGDDDYVISGAVGSQLLAQLADRPERRPVLLELYRAEGAGLHLVPCEDLAVTGETQFGDIVARALSAGLLAIGWRRSASRDAGVFLTPHLDELLRLQPGDEIIVIG